MSPNGASPQSMSDTCRAVRKHVAENLAAIVEFETSQVAGSFVSTSTAGLGRARGRGGEEEEEEEVEGRVSARDNARIIVDVGMDEPLVSHSCE